MVETFGAHYVSLHVRVSNTAAIRLYRDTLKFRTDKVEPKYYADGEDAFSMRLDLGYIREAIRDANDAEKARNGGAAEAASEGIDEGEAVGDVGSKPPGHHPPGEKLQKVRVGRGLGVGELVERVVTKRTEDTS